MRVFDRGIRLGIRQDSVLEYVDVKQTTFSALRASKPTQCSRKRLRSSQLLRSRLLRGLFSTNARTAKRKCHWRKMQLRCVSAAGAFSQRYRGNQRGPFRRTSGAASPKRDVRIHGDLGKNKNAPSGQRRGSPRPLCDRGMRRARSHHGERARLHAEIKRRSLALSGGPSHRSSSCG